MRKNVLMFRRVEDAQVARRVEDAQVARRVEDAQGMMSTARANCVNPFAHPSYFGPHKEGKAA